jgi:ring-1,2-phenylacetyl-CoA epoxidase subunit PaaD
VVNRTAGRDGKTAAGLAEQARTVLQLVKDPEVPVLSIVELGIVRDVQADPETGSVTVTITPTYSGCPAMQVIEAEITAALGRAGFSNVKIETVYAPAWTTDWIPEHAREKLRQFGIAPPGLVQLESRSRRDDQTPRRLDAETSICCPYCGSMETGLVSEFGATACKSLHVCRSCRQPFERFKTF